MRAACYTIDVKSLWAAQQRKKQLSFHNHGLQSCGSGRLVPFLFGCLRSNSNERQLPG